MAKSECKLYVIGDIFFFICDSSYISTRVNTVG